MSIEDKQWFKDWKEGYQTAFNEKYDALVAERDTLQKQLEVAREYIKYFRMVDEENDSIESVRDMANEAYSKIERIKGGE
jgi:hypothetical protein